METKQHRHNWAYEHTIYDGDQIRRWCHKCGLIQVGSVTQWTDSGPIGEDQEWGDYPDNYPKQFIVARVALAKAGL